MPNESPKDHELKAVNRPGSMTTELESEGQTFVSDQPKEMGGAGSGPDPYQLLLASLAACTAMTLRMYANRKNWPLEEVEVTFHYDRSYLQDCKDCEQPANKLSRLKKRITINGNLTPEQKQRLLEIADLCPVQKALAGGIHITSETTEPPLA